MNPTKRITSGLVAGIMLLLVVGCEKKANENSVVKEPSLQGRWTGYEKGSTERIFLEMTGDQFAYWDSQTNEIGSGKFIVNETVEPKQIDLTFEKMRAPEYAGKVGLAIYEIKDGELTFAGSEPGSTVRPTSIVGGDGVRVFVFKRE